MDGFCANFYGLHIEEEELYFIKDVLQIVDLFQSASSTDKHP